MTSTNFSVGRDCQLVVMGPYGRIDLTYVTAFESRQLTAPVRVDRIDGTQMAAELPKGWEGQFRAGTRIAGGGRFHRPGRGGVLCRHGGAGRARCTST